MFSWRVVAAWSLIALSPAITAAFTSNPASFENLTLHALRLYGMPYVFIEIIIIGLVVSLGLRPIRVLSDFPKWALLVLGSLLVIAIFSAVNAHNKMLAVYHLNVWIIHLLFGLCIVCLAETSPGEVKAWFWPGVVIGLIVLVILLIVYIISIPDQKSFDWRYFGFAVTNIRQIGYFTTVGAMASIGIALTQRRATPVAAASAAASIFLAVAFWSGSRSSPLASWVAVLLSLVWFNWLRNGRSIAIIAGGSGGGLLLSRLHSVPDKHFGLERITSSVETSTLETLSSGRLEIWNAAWKAILERPFFGHGQGQFGIVSEARALSIHQPHNSALQFAFDWGLIGAGCFAALFGYLFWYCLRITRVDPPGLLPAALVCTALLALSAFDGALFFPYPIMMVVAALGWIVGTGRAYAIGDRQGIPGRALASFASVEAQ